MKRVWRLIYFKIFRYACMRFGSLNNLNVGQHELNKIPCSTSISRVKPYMFDCLPFIIVFVLFCQYTHLDKHSVHKTASFTRHVWLYDAANFDLLCQACKLFWLELYLRWWHQQMGRKFYCNNTQPLQTFHP